MLHTVFVLFICWVMNESIQPNTVLMPFWIACKGATMSAASTVNTLTMKSRTLVKIVVAVVLMPVHTPDRNVVMLVHAVVMPPLIVTHRPERKATKPFHASEAPCVIDCHNPVRNSPSPFHTALAPSTSAVHVSESHEVNAAHALRPTSVWVKNQTSAATTAATATTIAPMGLAAMTALNAPCTAVAIFVAVLQAVCAVLTRLSPPAICLSMATGPPKSIMSMMPLLTPLAAVVTVVMVPVSACRPLLSA